MPYASYRRRCMCGDVRTYLQKYDWKRADLCVFAWVHSGVYTAAQWCTHHECRDMGILYSYRRACVYEYVRVRAYLCIFAWVHSGMYAVACTGQNVGTWMSYIHIDVRMCV